MGTQSLAKKAFSVPGFFDNMDDFFKPWNEWFGNKQMANLPAVNITESKDDYLVSLAAPGMKKEDFKIDINGNILTISAEKEETLEEKDKKFTRKEFNYTSFTRSFTLPDEVNNEMIKASYQDGLLKLVLPRKEESKKITAKHIAVN